MEAGSIKRLTEKQFDAMDELCKKEIFRDIRPDLRPIKLVDGETYVVKHETQTTLHALFASFTVNGVFTPCTWKHRYLILPDGTIEQLPTKTIDTAHSKSKLPRFTSTGIAHSNNIHHDLRESARR
jgi:hypothetical protein